MSYADAQRLAFGSVAELYDAYRPTYPAAAVDDVMAHARLEAGDQVVEVGAGTGKLTELLVARGLRVLAIEPSDEMAALLRARDLEGVEIVPAKFEQWRPCEAVPALVSASAWHWTVPETRYALAAAAVAPGGTAAATWTLPDWDGCALREPLRAAYRTAAPDLDPEFPMHPASDPVRLAGDWEGEIAAAEQFTDAEIRFHSSEREYDAETYTRMLCTHQDHILLGDDTRERLLSAIAAPIDDAGGTLRLPVVTRVCLARRAPVG